MFMDDVWTMFSGTIMGRTTTEVRLQERSARARLKQRPSPYWRMISEGRHIGYYRGARGGTWVARYRPAGVEGNGAKKALGVADDITAANGETILNWKEALEKASEWFELQESGGSTLDPNVTVKEALDSFIAMRDERQFARVGRKVKSTASSTLRKHVLRDHNLTALKLCDLAESDLRDWQRRLSGIKGTTKLRILSDLKAALNATFEEHRKALPKDFASTIKFGLKPVFAIETADEPAARANQVLTDQQIREIIAKAREMDVEGDNFRLAILLAATGARFSQVARMRVADVQPVLGRVLVPTSYKGKGQKAVRYIRIQVSLDVFRALAPAIEGRDADAPLLERWHHKQVDSTKWIRVERQPWKTPSEMRRWWQTVVDAAGYPGVIPYALRHSSIVRGIGAGLPIRLVAALHDTSTAMIEKHYARWITESLDDIAARAIVSLTDEDAVPDAVADESDPLLCAAQ